MRLSDDWRADTDTLAARTILVTGATGGLGRASALACARAGARVVLLGRNVPALEALYDELETVSSESASIYPMDLEGATPADYAELVETVQRECEGLHGIVHAAARFNGLQPVGDIKPEDWMRSMQVNLNGPFLLTQAALPALQSQADASVVFVLDDPTRVQKAFWGAYGVAKAALVGLVATLHQETERSSVRVHGLLPAPMRSALRRMAYFGENTQLQAEPDARGVVFLLSPAALTARGSTLDLRS